MNYLSKFYLLFLLVTIILFSCKNKKNNDSTNTVTQPNVTEYSNVTTKEDTSASNFTVMPKQQVGNVISSMSEADLKRVYGEKNVARVNRGDVKTVIYPNSDNELEISWKKGQEYKKLEVAIIRKGDWKTAEGIQIGSTVEDLERINGKKIDLYTLEDGIAIVRWQGGSVNKNLKVLVNLDTKKVMEMQIDF
jgi:hypothetical protein